MSIDAWNIEGIANEVMKAMHVDQAPVENADGYVQKIAYLGDTGSAGAVAALVKERVEEMYEET